MRYLKKLLDTNVRQRLLVSLCLLLVCIGTQQMQTTKWDSGFYELFRDSLGLYMAIIIFTHFNWDNVRKHCLPYKIWAIAGGSITAIFTFIAINKRYSYLLADSIVIALGIYLMGFCLLYTFIDCFIEKNRRSLYMPLFIVWLVMFVLMIISKSEYIWPACYLITFGCFYLTNQTSEQRENVFIGIMNGLILGYVLIQGHSLLTRPYDRLRYYGNFCNPNHNCVFLCFCLAAILAKILFATKNKSKLYIRVFYILLAETCISCILMTLCRSGYFTIFLMIFIFLIFYCRIREKLVFLRMGITLYILLMVMFPATYLAIRYVPTIHPHVNFYFQEGYSEDRVHSWDERDSEKFIPYETIKGSIYNRFSSTYWKLRRYINPNLVHNGDKENITIQRDLYPQTAFILLTGNTPLKNSPALSFEEAANEFTVRYTIYKWYIEHLSLRGMPYDEQGFQLTEEHWIQDTHNIYLDYGINFGWPVMILIIILSFWGAIRLFIQGWKTKDIAKMASLFLLIIPPVFGMFEFAWGAGTLYTIAYYLSCKEVFQ